MLTAATLSEDYAKFQIAGLEIVKTTSNQSGCEQQSPEMSTIFSETER
jgi:hypothetical protein